MKPTAGKKTVIPPLTPCHRSPSIITFIPAAVAHTLAWLARAPSEIQYRPDVHTRDIHTHTLAGASCSLACTIRRLISNSYSLSVKYYRNKFDNCNHLSIISDSLALWQDWEKCACVLVWGIMNIKWDQFHQNDHELNHNFMNE